MAKTRRVVSVTILAAALGTVAWIVSEVHWAFTATPAPTVDYSARLNAAVAEAQKDRAGPDAWPALVDALDLYTTTRDANALKYAAKGLRPDGWPEGCDWPDSYGDLRGLADAPAVVRDRAMQLLAEIRAAGVLERFDAVCAAGRFVRPI